MAELPMSESIPVHISRIRAGDTVLHDGKMRTVCSKDIRRDLCMGITLWGDSYRLGYTPVQKYQLSKLKENANA